MVNQYQSNDLRRQKQVRRVAILQRALRILNDYRRLYARISADHRAEMQHVHTAIARSKRI